MDMGDQLRFLPQRTPLTYPPTVLRPLKVNDVFWEEFLTSRLGCADSQEDVEVCAPSPDIRNGESAAARSRARKETTNELELKVSQLQEQNYSCQELSAMVHALQGVVMSRLEGMASQEEVEVYTQSPDLRNRELLHATKETSINELELKVSQLEDENSKLKAKYGQTEPLQRSSAMFLSNQDDSIASVAQANQFTTAFASSKKDGKKTQTKIGLGLNLEDLEPHFGKRLEDVAEELDVGRSTIKRVCRNYGINRWPCNKKNKSNPTNGISCRDSKQNVPPSAASSKNVTMKVGFEDDTIKFDFCLSSGMEKLLSEVGRRLNLKVGGFKLKYLDEDGDDILLACDDDLQFYLKSLANVVEKTCIKLFVHL